MNVLRYYEHIEGTKQSAVQKCVLWNGAVENQSKLVLNYLLHGFSILWRGAKQHAEGLVIPHVPNEAATQFLPLAEHMLRYMANPDVPIAAKSAKLNKVKLETLFHGYHVFSKVDLYKQLLLFSVYFLPGIGVGQKETTVTLD